MTDMLYDRWDWEKKATETDLKPILERIAKPWEHPKTGETRYYVGMWDYAKNIAFPARKSFYATHTCWLDSKGGIHIQKKWGVDDATSVQPFLLDKVEEWLILGIRARIQKEFEADMDKQVYEVSEWDSSKPPTTVKEVCDMVYHYCCEEYYDDGDYFPEKEYFVDSVAECCKHSKTVKTDMTDAEIRAFATKVFEVSGHPGMLYSQCNA